MNSGIGYDINNHNMITKLTLSNFKCFATPESFEFARINLLTGQNGRGKSSVLQSMLLLAQSYNQEGISQLLMNGRLVRMGTYADIFRYGAEKPEIIINFVTDDIIENHIDCVFVKSKTSNEIALFQELDVDHRSRMEELSQFRELSTSDGNKLVTSDNKKILVKEVLERVVGVTQDIEGLRQLKEVYFISADRFGGIDQSKIELFWQPYLGTGTHGEYLMQALFSCNEEQLSQINQSLVDLFGSGCVKVEKDESKNELFMFIDPAGGTERFKPSHVGFGYSYVLTILTTFVMAEKGAKIFIENPEAHLHPAAQAKILQFMIEMSKQKQLQIFIESHSDHILHGCQIAVHKKVITPQDLSVYSFDFDELTPNLSYPQKLEVLSSGHIKRPPIGFFDQAEQDLAAILGF